MTLKQRDLAFLDITMGILFFLIYSIRVSAVSENIAPPSYQTEREVKVSIFKNEKQLEVKKFEIILGSCSYSKDYSSYKGKITNGMTGIYNARPQVGDSIFSEYAGIFKPFTQLNDSTYVLSDPGSRHQSFYYYKNGIMIKGKMPNAIMDFYFVLRSTR